MIYTVVGLGGKGGEREKTREQERGSIFIPTIGLLSALLEIRLAYPRPRGGQQDPQQSATTGVRFRLSAQKVSRVQGETPPLSLFTISPLVPLQREAPAGRCHLPLLCPESYTFLPGLVPRSCLPDVPGSILCVTPTLCSHTSTAALLRHSYTDSFMCLALMMLMCYTVGLRSPWGQGPCLFTFDTPPSPTDNSDLKGHSFPQLPFPPK